MQKSTKKNRYKYKEHDCAYVILESTLDIVEVKVMKRLKRPYRLSDNFYFCTWSYAGKIRQGIKYEKEMYKDYNKIVEKQERLKREKRAALI